MKSQADFQDSKDRHHQLQNDKDERNIYKKSGGIYSTLTTRKLCITVAYGLDMVRADS